MKLNSCCAFVCPQSLEGKALGKCFGRDTEVILEAVHPGKAKVVTWTITCVKVGNGRRVEGGRRLMLCICFAFSWG